MIRNVEKQNIPKRKDRISIQALSFGVMFLLVVTLALFPSIFDNISVTLIFFLIIVVPLLGGGWLQRFIWQNSWRDFAANTGLIYRKSKPPGGLFDRPKVIGKYQGFPVHVERYTRGTGKYQKVYTQIRVILKLPLSSLLIINRKTWFSNIKRLYKPNSFEAKFVDLGDEDFGRRVEVKSDSESFARAILSLYRVRQGFREIAAQAPEMKIVVRDNEILYTERGNITDTEYLTAILNTLIDFAKYLERYEE